MTLPDERAVVASVVVEGRVVLASKRLRDTIQASSSLSLTSVKEETDALARSAKDPQLTQDLLAGNAIMRSSC